MVENKEVNNDSALEFLWQMTILPNVVLYREKCYGIC